MNRLHFSPIYGWLCVLISNSMNVTEIKINIINFVNNKINIVFPTAANNI